MRPETEQLGRVFDVRHPETVDLEPSLDAWFADRAKSLELAIDWESRRWQAAVAAMQGMISREPWASWTNKQLAEGSVIVADALIAEFKKTEPPHAS